MRTYTGHGINDQFHPAPNIPHYSKNKAIGTMKAGTVRLILSFVDVILLTMVIVLHDRTRRYQAVSFVDVYAHHD